MSADWLGICRRIVKRQQVLFDEAPTVAARDHYDGIGEGGDHTLVLDRLCEDIVFEELEQLAGQGPAFTAISEERGLVPAAPRASPRCSPVVPEGAVPADSDP